MVPFLLAGGREDWTPRDGFVPLRPVVLFAKHAHMVLECALPGCGVKFERTNARRSCCCAAHGYQLRTLKNRKARVWK